MADQEEIKKEEIETTIECPDCGKRIYTNEICSCKKTDTDNLGFPNIKKPLPNEERVH